MSVVALRLTPEGQANYDRFCRLADRLANLMTHTARLQARRDEASLKLGQLRGAVVMAEAELAAAEKAVQEDIGLSRPVGEFLLDSMERIPHWGPMVPVEEPEPE